MAADNADVLAADNANVLAADTTDVLAADNNFIRRLPHQAASGGFLGKSYDLYQKSMIDASNAVNTSEQTTSSVSKLRTVTLIED